MPHKVFVTGGSGFVGSSVIAALLRAGHAVHALTNKRPLPPQPSLTSFRGDLFDPASLDTAMASCDAVIHLVGIIMEHPARGITFERMHHQGTVAVVDAAKRNGIRRFVQMSALGVRPDAVSEYHKTKFRAEQYLRASGLDFTIFQPSLIHGPRGDFMKMEATWARGRAPAPLFFQPFMPYFGGSRAGLLQPVYVEDVARAFVEALDKPETIGQTYPLAGPDQITWPQLHAIVAEAVVGHRRLIASIPIPIAKLLVATGIAPVLGFNRDQLIMSQENNTADMTKFIHDFGWTPQPFAPLVTHYAKEL
jgi:NADH dehydrogenase